MSASWLSKILFRYSRNSVSLILQLGCAKISWMNPADFQRARSPEAKQQREDAILAAARSLGAERGIRQITLTDIADTVGMHKSALLRYFETREQIFLRLTAEDWREWSAALRAKLERAARSPTVEKVASA